MRKQSQPPEPAPTVGNEDDEAGVVIVGGDGERLVGGPACTARMRGSASPPACGPAWTPTAFG
jgi:hypothetical protein